eukprot:TRINITY_DN11409_c0_g3_i1.p1 TRINITY_DN11409_c0_g3~~TRINITY_DN11409_c0_g3_i1.p1  ORF type:complete len:346 (+),score=59.84 TRINITY_DN11409_c0_g3_i1:121-1158(+)
MFAIPIHDSKQTQPAATGRVTIARVRMLNGFSIGPTEIISYHGLKITFVADQPGVTISFQNDKGYARAYVHGYNKVSGGHGTITGNILCNDSQVVAPFLMEHRRRYSKLIEQGQISSSSVHQYPLFNGDVVSIELVPPDKRSNGARLGSSLSQTGVPRAPARLRRRPAASTAATSATTSTASAATTAIASAASTTSTTSATATATTANALRPKGGIRKRASRLSTSTSAVQQIAVMTRSETDTNYDLPIPTPPQHDVDTKQSSNTVPWSMNALSDGTEEQWFVPQLLSIQNPADVNAMSAPDPVLADGCYLDPHLMLMPVTPLEMLPDQLPDWPPQSCLLTPSAE